MQAAECLNTENSIIYKRKACNFAIQTQSFYENFFLSQFFSFSASSTVKYANEIQKTNRTKTRNRISMTTYRKFAESEAEEEANENIIYSLISLMIILFFDSFP